MANMSEMGLEIFNAGGGWRDQKWAPSWSVKLHSLRQGRVQTLPCSLGRQSARSSSLERGKPRLSALKRRFLKNFSLFLILSALFPFCALYSVFIYIRMEDVFKGRLTSVIIFIQIGKSRYTTLHNKNKVSEYKHFHEIVSRDGTMLIPLQWFIKV
ncbi:hypothetical protein T03_5004 [Trichinella britovi]|uniref:Uncharacterized protein n=1 Tax=Trichinella britovi TaxID=45882 RepID=A0A0V1D3D3_TRIBR|nr:hypothetical protein T03_5004 [Trichinella britovi]